MKSYLYIGTLYDTFKDRPVGINDKKIGITNDPQIREHSLSRTKSPIGVSFIKLWKFEGKETAQIIEHYILHNLLSDRKTVGEWYNDVDDSIIQSVEQTITGLNKLQHFQVEEIDLETESTELEKKQIRKSKSKNMVVTIDGKTYDEKNNKLTYIKVIEELGVGNFSNYLGESYITKDENNKFYSVHKIDEYFLNVNTSTEHKVKLLNKGLKNLNVDYKVEII
jgi:hypothetical protein